jgi:hypothetical protein
MHTRDTFRLPGRTASTVHPSTPSRGGPTYSPWSDGQNGVPPRRSPAHCLQAAESNLLLCGTRRLGRVVSTAGRLAPFFLTNGRQGMASRGRAGRVPARSGTARQAWHGKPRLGWAWHGGAGKAGPGASGHGMASHGRHGMAGRVVASRGVAWQGSHGI